jgi:hypothetical protein
VRCGGSGADYRGTIRGYKKNVYTSTRIRASTCWCKEKSQDYRLDKSRLWGRRLPLKPRPHPFPKRLPKGKRVTVCIAAACRNGEYVVSCTDGALSQGGETFDLALAKMTYFEDWQIMYAGEPSNADLILENVRQACRKADALTRENIQATIRRAYKKRFAEWTADYVLAPYDMDMDEFKRKGRKIFSDQQADKIAREMSNVAGEFKEELMVVGWGRTPIAVMIYGMNQSGPWSGLLSGIGAIGAGAEVARATLLLHGITRSSTLEDTLYAVAAAKFSAERCEAVGQNTTIHVSRKRRRGDQRDGHVGEFLTAREVRGLRRAWLRFGRMRVPDEAYPRLLGISQRITGGVGPQAAIRVMRSMSRRSRRNAGGDR